MRLLNFSGKWVLEGVQPDGFTIVCLLSACAELGALALGRRAHVYILKIGLNVNLHVNALLDLYAKCRSIRLLLFLMVIVKDVKDTAVIAEDNS